MKDSRGAIEVEATGYTTGSCWKFLGVIFPGMSTTCRSTRFTSGLPWLKTKSYPIRGDVASMRSMDQVYVLRAGSLGDAIVSLPAWEFIAQRHPGKVLHLITPSQQYSGIPDAAVVFGMTGRLGEVIRYEKNPRHLRAVAARVRELGRGVVYCLMPERATWTHVRDYAFLRGLCGLRPRGLSTAILGNWRQGPLRPAYSPAVEWKRLLSCVGGSEHQLRFPMLTHSEAAAGFAAHLTASLGNRRFMVACPGSKMPAKRWPIENYRRVFERFFAVHGDARALLVGSPSERGLCEELAFGDPERISNLAGELTLDQSAAVCSRAVCYFGNDTGAMHLAAALGKPCVALFTARDYREKWYPFGPDHVIFRQDVPCQGCMLEECLVEKMKCLTQIDPLAVSNALLALWHGKTNDTCPGLN